MMGADGVSRQWGQTLPNLAGFVDRGSFIPSPFSFPGSPASLLCPFPLPLPTNIKDLLWGRE